jgi:DNA repair exonuclease SbcCD ATPase subunit
MAEKTMSASEVEQEMIRGENAYRAFARGREMAAAVTGLEGQKSALSEAIKELESRKQALEKELNEITEIVNQARTDSKANMAKIQAEVDAKKKSAAEDIADMDKEYEEARVRANDKLAAQLQAGRDEVDAWTKDLSDIQKKFHRLEADMQMLERKAQA